MHLGFSSMNTVHDPRPADLAKILEEAGFESLWYGEHSHIPMARKTPYPPGGELPEPYKEMMDPYISLMEAAAVTSKLKLGTGIAQCCGAAVASAREQLELLTQVIRGRGCSELMQHVVAPLAWCLMHYPVFFEQIMYCGATQYATPVVETQLDPLPEARRVAVAQCARVAKRLKDWLR